MKNEKTPDNIEPVRSTGFVGLWTDGTLGWVMPKHFSKYGGNKPNMEQWNEGATVYYCEITVKIITNKNGEYIKRYIGGKKGVT